MQSSVDLQKSQSSEILEKINPTILQIVLSHNKFRKKIWKLLKVQFFFWDQATVMVINTNAPSDNKIKGKTYKKEQENNTTEKEKNKKKRTEKEKDRRKKRTEKRKGQKKRTE